METIGIDMATYNREYLSKEEECFAAHLYEYIWKRHKFSSKSLQEGFVKELPSEVEYPYAYKCDKLENAVLCSQYLFRDYCEFTFKRYENGPPINTSLFFYECVFKVINIWFQNRRSVFIKVIDSLAIIAEAILYCDAKLNIAIELKVAPQMFCTFFVKYLLTDFLANGGWRGLEKEIERSYRELPSILPKFIYDLKEPYKKLQHDCSLIQNLKKLPMVFPLSMSMFCTECSDVKFCGCNHREEFFYAAFKKIWSDNFEQEESLKNIEARKKEYHTFLLEEYSKKDHIHNEGCFKYLLLGKKEKKKRKKRRKIPKLNKPESFIIELTTSDDSSNTVNEES